MREITKKCPTCGSLEVYSLNDLSAPDYFVMGVSNRPSVQSEVAIYLQLSEEEQQQKRGKVFCRYCKQFHQLSLGISENELYEKAYGFWKNYDFESAMDTYTAITTQDEYAHKAYWHLALCRGRIAEDEHGLYYVERPGTSIFDDADYKKTMSCTAGYTEALQYRGIADGLKQIRDDYLELENDGKKYHVCVCHSSQGRYGEIGKKVLNILAEKRKDLSVYDISLSTPIDNLEADICYAINKANILIIVGDELDGLVKTRFWRPFVYKMDCNPGGYYSILRVSDSSSAIPEDLVLKNNIHPDNLEDEEVGLLPLVAAIYEPPKEIKTETHIHTTVIEDTHTKEKLDLAYQSFIKGDFITAQKGAVAVLQNCPDSIPAKYILAFYQSFIENTANRNAVHKFFDENKYVSLCDDDVKQIKNLFLVSATKIMAFEEDVIGMLMRAESGPTGIAGFADIFCVKIIPLQKSIDFLTDSRLNMYCKLAQEGAVKTCLALLSIIKTNPDSPIPGNKFYLTERAVTFRDRYMKRIEKVILSMQNSEVRAKFAAVYRNELMKYEQQMRAY